MEAILTVRLDRSKKERGTAILRAKGMTPSSAVQKLFDYVVRTGDLPFEKAPCLSEAEIARRAASFKALQWSTPVNMTDREIREARLRERHGIDAG
jgi:RHH-type rel operon transcriptional repressor/antitoxin RelB